MNIGLFGFTNKHYYLATKTQEKYTKPFGSDGSLSPLDYSVGIGTGLELGKVRISRSFLPKLT
ncbi:hypothetical protein MBO76_005955, partial [Klebsiella pneumoniae]